MSKSKQNEHIPFCCGTIPCIKWKNPISPCYELTKDKSDPYEQKKKKK